MIIGAQSIEPEHSCRHELYFMCDEQPRHALAIDLPA